jgi:hypothetical protein
VPPFRACFPKPGGALTKKKGLKGCTRRPEIPTENKKSRRTPRPPIFQIVKLLPYLFTAYSGCVLHIPVVYCALPCFRGARGRRFELRVASLLAQHRVKTSQVKLILSPKQRAKPAASSTRTCTNAAVCIASGECPSRF